MITQILLAASALITGAGASGQSGQGVSPSPAVRPPVLPQSPARRTIPAQPDTPAQVEIPYVLSCGFAAVGYGRTAVLLRNDGPATIPAGTRVRWLVQYNQYHEEGEGMLFASLPSGQTRDIDTLTNPTFMGRPCTASVVD